MKVETRADGGSAGAMAPRTGLALIRELCSALDDAGITYCHWKSNHELARSASGENDLDLLIGRNDVARFDQIVSSLGFKRARHPRDKEIPGVVHYYGLDQASGRLVDIHAHYQLVLGHDATKNYRLPIEDAYLRGAVQGPLFKVPEPEFEFIVFVVRMVLKHCPWDSVISAQGTLSPAERREHADLLGRIEERRVDAILRTEVAFIDHRLFRQSRQALDRQAPLWFRMKVARELQAALAGFARRPEPVDTALRMARRSKNGLRHVSRKHARGVLESGGAVVALVGGDGAGKSSAARELGAWLSPHVVTVSMHLGKPPMTAGSVAVRATMRAGRSLGAFKSIGPKPTPGARPANIWLLRHALIARDRYRASVKARRHAAVGAVVICDRYPVPQIRLMDGPVTTSIGQSRGLTRLGRFLVQYERDCYRRIWAPDVLIVLRVAPRVAVQRKGEEDSTFVQRRSQEVWGADWSSTGAFVIDADRPMNEVVAEIRSILWTVL